MRRILLYVVLVVFSFWGFQHVKSSWENNDRSLDSTYAEVKGEVLKWYETATDSSKELKDKLNAQIESAGAKYEQIKNEIESVNNKVNEKRDQLEQTLKEMEEAKKALDALLDREKEEAATSGEQTPQ